ncbi:hypothetical protein AVDCRST_MAG84-2792, partial [uncultured Microcoleus sp.]
VGISSEVSGKKAGFYTPVHKFCLSQKYESSAAHKQSMFLCSGFDIASPKSTATSNSALLAHLRIRWVPRGCQPPHLGL